MYIYISMYTYISIRIYILYIYIYIYHVYIYIYISRQNVCNFDELLKLLKLYAARTPEMPQPGSFGWLWERDLHRLC